MSLQSDVLKEMGESVVSYDNFQDEIMIVEFNQANASEKGAYNPTTPSRLSAMVFIGITAGELECQIDYIKYKALSNSLIMILPTHITNMICGSDDLRGWIIVLSKTYLEKMSFDKQMYPSFISYMQLKKDPLIIFDPNEYKSLCLSVEFIRQKTHMKSHLFCAELVKSAMAMFFLDLGNFYLGKRENVIRPTLNRQEELFEDFQTLLREHCKTNHEVSFYADKLCITTQYLSSILKKQSGMSANQWIHEALMIEAKGLLNAPRISIQQIADELHFPDQSTFGKFFKKHEGISPKSFRKLRE